MAAADGVTGEVMYKNGNIFTDCFVAEVLLLVRANFQLPFFNEREAWERGYPDAEVCKKLATTVKI